MLVHLTGETGGDCRVVEVPVIKVPEVTFYLTERESSTKTIFTKTDIRHTFRSSDVHVSVETETQEYDEAGFDQDDLEDELHVLLIFHA